MTPQPARSFFGAITFFATKHSGDMCGSNGLPLTPNSIAIYGQSQFLKTIKHPNLCEYIDIIRGKHERIVVVSEFYDRSLSNYENELDIKIVAYSILEGLCHLNQLGIVHRVLSPDNILLDSKNRVKLFNYGLYFMTLSGSYVSFPIGNPKYMAPEIFLGTSLSSPKVDIWSLGIIIAELALNKVFWSNLKLPQIIRKILSLLVCSGTVLERIANEHNCLEAYNSLDPDLKDFINDCLIINPEKRPLPREVCGHKFFKKINNEMSWDENDIGFHVGFLKRISRENVTLVKRLLEIRNESDDERKPVRELGKRSLKEIYFLWQLAGGDVLAELKKQGMIKSKPPILTLPNVITLEGVAFGEKRDQSFLLDLRVVPLPMDSLNKRIEQLPFPAFHPLLETVSEIIGRDEVPEAGSLPLVIREKDFHYQFHRIVLFQRLLLGYPSNTESILKEANKDIPPFYRGDIWAALLGVKGDIEGLYRAIDKHKPSATDRQIEVDIPRCHQYNELLASKEGHRRLKRILKAWVISHPQYVYWQGLDSLCAPFLYLNFINEAQAYACLSAFIPKYLHNFFLKDNSSVIQEYLAKFRQLLAYHDPQLACHLESIKFIPELFAIPWFLTVFSHVFPLQKILYLWDRVLLGDASFPLYVGLAVLNQLRATLLTSGFNECILLFSDLPDVDIESCVKDSTAFYESTPRSITLRHFEIKTPSLAVHEPGTPLNCLQKEFCPRISPYDFWKLMSEQSRCLAVDIRGHDAYQMDSIVESINIPFNSISLSESKMPSTKEGTILEENRGKIMLIIGSGGENLSEFCRWLVECGFPHVCSVNGGFQAIKQQQL